MDSLLMKYHFTFNYLRYDINLTQQGEKYFLRVFQEEITTFKTIEQVTNVDFSDANGLVWASWATGVN